MWGYRGRSWRGWWIRGARPDDCRGGRRARGQRECAAAGARPGAQADLQFRAARECIRALVSAGELELEIIPQGTIAERLRAAGAGIEAFYTPTGADTLLAEGRETREINGRLCLLEYPLRGDVALLEAWQADRWGNLVYREAQQNFNPVMAMAADLTIAQTYHMAELGDLEPNVIATPGVFVRRVLHVPTGEANG